VGSREMGSWSRKRGLVTTKEVMIRLSLFSISLLTKRGVYGAWISEGKKVVFVCIRD
jgi:hypothetical protein